MMLGEIDYTTIFYGCDETTNDCKEVKFLLISEITDNIIRWCSLVYRRWSVLLLGNNVDVYDVHSTDINTDNKSSGWSSG